MEEDGPKGYERLARLIGEYPELAIFRRFGALNLQNIIELQAELTEMEHGLQLMVAEDNHNSDPHSRIFPKAWRIDETTIDNEPENPAHKLVLRIRKVLSNYNNALMQQAAILALQPPADDDLNLIKAVTSSPIFSRDNLLMGPDGDTWHNSLLRPDLVKLRPRPESEKKFSKRVTHFLIRLITKLVHSHLVRWNNMELVYYSSSENLEFIMQVITAILSSLFLLISLVVLYFVRPPGARFGIVGAFTVIFSLSLALLPSANRNEIFGATAACIAVQIVFVGTN